MDENNKTCILAVRVTPELKESVEEAAKKDRRSVTQFITIMIEKYLKDEEQK